MKKRIVTLALVVALVATCFGGTLAYLKDTKAVKNIFTTGNVYITLDEAKVTQDPATGVLSYDGRTSENQNQTYKLFPNMTVTKDPTITLHSNSENAYVAAKVTVSGDLLSLIPMDGSTDLININAIADGGLLDDSLVYTYGEYNGLTVFQNDECAVYQKAEGSNTWTLYVFMKKPQVKNTAITLFSTLNINKEWGNVEMAKINGMIIDVEAYAAQAYGFANCYDAMTKAFGTEFSF